MTDERSITFLLRVEDRNPAHTRIGVFAGSNPGARGKAGQLAFRNEEWELLRGRLLSAIALGIIGVDEMEIDDDWYERTCR